MMIWGELHEQNKDFADQQDDAASKVRVLINAAHHWTFFLHIPTHVYSGTLFKVMVWMEGFEAALAAALACW